MYHKEVLANGLRVVYQEIPHVYSVSIGVWIGTGSRHETHYNNGISHFIEHMLFKGTSQRSARDIAEQIDNVGGQLNAFTAKECTCYFAKVINTHAELALDILSDMIINSSFSEEAIDKEKNVVMEEISMYEDSPEELVHDFYAHTIFKGHSLGYPILGGEQSIGRFDRKLLIEYFKQNYRPDNAVVSIVGNADFKEILELVNTYFGCWEAGCPAEALQPALPMNYELAVREKDTEQVHLCLGFKGLDLKDQKLYSLLAFNNMLGGGMSSRLFQKIREDLGLVYSVYSYSSSYSDTGIMTVYAGMSPSNLQDVVEQIIYELTSIKTEGISSQELNRIKEQMKGNHIMSLESTSSRMASMGKSELLLGRIFSEQEVIQSIDEINMCSISEVLDDIIRFDSMAAAALGKNTEKLFKTLEMMKC